MVNLRKLWALCQIFHCALWCGYNRGIAPLGDILEILTCLERLYNAVHERQQRHLMDYKRDDYTLQGQDYVRVEKEQGR